MARLPVTPLLLLGFLQAQPSSGGPINVFRPETGQLSVFHIFPLRESDVIERSYDTLELWISRKSEDTAFYRFDYSRDSLASSLERRMAWSQGRLRAGQLLSSIFLDTNGIYGRRKDFPEDYRGTTTRNGGGSGYTLQHVVSGFVFDTLLVSCAYEAATDGGDNCDFITTSGILVYSNLWGMSSFRRLPDSGALAGMGGRPVTVSVRSAAPGWKGALSRARDAFDALGRVRLRK